jgi:CRISPR-associated protein Cmr1
MLGVRVQSIQIELETITPLFLSGADQHVAELRAPAFRGALRYWLRALLGGQRGFEDIARVFEVESSAFGSPNSGSPIGLRVAGRPETQHWYPPASLRGIQYLLFSIRQRDPRTRQEIIRPSIPAGTPFSLIIQRVGQQVSIEALQHALGALWLLCNLGGLGARSRRGVGSLAVRSGPIVYATQEEQRAVVKDALARVPSLHDAAATPLDLQTSLHKGLSALQPDYRSIADLPEFDILHPNWSRIIVINPRRPWRRWDEALEAVGQTFKNFRFQLADDHKRVGSALRSRTPELETVERAAFGLPIVFFYRGAGQSSLEGEEHDRRASPLHIHIARLANGTYTVVLTCFKSMLLPIDEKTQQPEQMKLPQLDRRPPTIRVQQPDLEILDEFLNSLNAGQFPLGEPLEVRL